MSNPAIRKHPRAIARTQPSRKSSDERYLTDARGKRIAIVLDLAEYQQLVAGKRETASTRAPQAAWDWITAARDLRARAALAPDSTPILHALREERARR